MADIAHTAEHHLLKGSSPSSGEPPTFEPVAVRPTPNSRGQRDAEQVALIRHAHRVAATAQENNTEVNRLSDLQTRLETEGPRRPKKPAQPPLRQTIVDTSTATEQVLTVTNPKGRDPAWIEWQRVVDEAEAAFARDQAAFGKAIGLDDQNRVCDRLRDKLIHQAQALTVMEACSPVALAAKANAWIEVMAAGGGDQWDYELVMSIAQDAVSIGIDCGQRNPLGGDEGVCATVAQTPIPAAPSADTTDSVAVMGRETAALWRRHAQLEEGHFKMEGEERKLAERTIDRLERQARTREEGTSYHQATSLEGALFQLVMLPAEVQVLSTYATSDEAFSNEEVRPIVEKIERILWSIRGVIEQVSGLDGDDFAGFHYMPLRTNLFAPIEFCLKKASAA